MGAFSLIVVINLLNRSVIELCVENATQLFQGSLRPSTSFREGTIGSGVEIGRRIRTQKQKRGVENQVHPSQGEEFGARAADPSPQGPQEDLPGKRPPEATGENWCPERRQNEARLRPLIEGRRFLGTKIANTSYETRFGQINSPRPSSHQTETHSSQETDCECPQLHGASREPETH